MAEEAPGDFLPRWLRFAEVQNVGPVALLRRTATGLGTGWLCSARMQGADAGGFVSPRHGAEAVGFVPAKRRAVGARASRPLSKSERAGGTPALRAVRWLCF